MSGFPRCAMRAALRLTLATALVVLLGCGATTAPAPPGGNPSGMAQINAKLTIVRQELVLQGIDLFIPNGGIMGQLDNVLVRDSVDTETVILPLPFPQDGLLRMRHNEPINLPDRDGNVQIVIATNDADGLTLFTSSTDVILLRGEISFTFEILSGQLNTFPSAVEQFVLPTAGGTAGDFAFRFVGLPPGTRVQAVLKLQDVTGDQTVDHTVNMEDIVEMDGRADLTSLQTTRVSRITGMTFTFQAP